MILVNPQICPKSTAFFLKISCCVPYRKSPSYSISYIKPLLFWTPSAVSLFKSGSPTLISNYRPISRLPQIVKTLEKILHHRIYDYLENNDIICPEESDFLPSLGTNDTVGKFLGDVYLNINGGTPSFVFFTILLTIY